MRHKKNLSVIVLDTLCPSLVVRLHSCLMNPKMECAKHMLANNEWMNRLD